MVPKFQPYTARYTASLVRVEKHGFRTEISLILTEKPNITIMKAKIMIILDLFGNFVNFLHSKWQFCSEFRHQSSWILVTSCSGPKEFVNLARILARLLLSTLRAVSKVSYMVLHDVLIRFLVRS